MKTSKGVSKVEKDLAKYVHEKMVRETKNYQWRIVLDSHKRALEIYFVISIETNDGQFVQDINGQVNDSGLLQFEEVVCFYDETNYRLIPKNYLKAIPFNPEIGIDQGLVDAFLKQLNIIIVGSFSKLREFLIDASQNEFELHWNEVNMQKTVETLKATNHYSTVKYTFTENNDKTIVEQFKEEQIDGVERI